MRNKQGKNLQRVFRNLQPSKRGQLTIFIIIAIILVASVGLFFAFRDVMGAEQVPTNLEPPYLDFLSCVEENVLVGIEVLESQAGYIDLPTFQPGSRQMPFSSQLDFLGNPIPYWYYVSGNNLHVEQIPSKSLMEMQLAEFIEQEIDSDCLFEEYKERGFEIDKGETKAKINIKDNRVDVLLNMRLGISRSGERAILSSHQVSVDSRIGKLYGSAKKIYEYEQNTLFLEEYAIDTLRLNAPVDGLEFSCSPKTWNADEIFDDLEIAIEENTLAMRAGDQADYFAIDLPVNEEVRFITSKNWPRAFEVVPSEQNLLMATPIGNQQGLGVLGFCYIPYHFVYDVRYPVLIQVYEGDEIFQFPMAVVLENNNPRESLDVSAVAIESPEICKYKNTLLDVKVYDLDSNEIEADISYECFGETCSIGKSPLNTEFPQCVNGQIIARADGFEDTKIIFSIINAGNIQIFMEKLYELDLDLKVDGTSYNGEAIIYFSSEDVSQTVIYPDQQTVKLSEGDYEIQVYIYKKSPLILEATTVEQCVDVPSSGIGGFFGTTRKECFDLKIPEQTVETALAGGGKQVYYATESELKDSRLIEIDASSLPLPESLTQLQDNYLLFEDKELGITIK